MRAPPPPFRARRFRGARTLRSQRGIVMVFTLIALVLMLIAVVAVVRSVDTSSGVVGNLAFRRDLTNRAELAIAQAKAALNAGGAVHAEASRSADLVAAHYSATRLASPAGGIGVPAVLVSNSAYDAAGYSCMNGSGVALANCSTPGADGVVVRWIIDRQCVAGTSAFGTNACAYLSSPKDAGGSSHSLNRKPSGGSRSLFRISVRVTGPRNTEAYIQTTAG
jgi:type IV pilus assembly protein PilX